MVLDHKIIVKVSSSTSLDDKKITKEIYQSNCVKPVKYASKYYKIIILSYFVESTKIIEQKT